LYDNKNNKRRYEHKNIVDRFIIECINDGLMNNCDIENLFFNNVLESKEQLIAKTYYKKMISEYIEKKIYINQYIASAINDTFAFAHIKFKELIKTTKTIIEQTEIEKVQESINCSIVSNSNNSNSNNNNSNNNINNNSSTDVGNVGGSTVVNFNSPRTLNNHANHYIIKYRDYTKKLCIARYEKLAGIATNFDVVRMLLRYSIFDSSSQQWSFGVNLYECIGELYDINIEMFASPLNNNMPHYCSIFNDTDIPFRSLCNFNELSTNMLTTNNIKGAYFNPPYITLMMDKSIDKCLQILDEMERSNYDFTLISFLPNWLDAPYINRFLQSKYIVSYKSMKKGDYIIQEKDTGHIIRGNSFEILVVIMNSIVSVEKKKEIDNNFKGMIKYMIDESKYSKGCVT
jgi:hypothetical protein